MAFSVNEIRSQLTFGGARNTLFSVQFSNPSNGIADIKVPFMIKAASIPEARLGVIEVPYFGRKIKLAGKGVTIGLRMRGLSRSHEDVAAEAGLVLDAHGAGPLNHVLGVPAANSFEEEVHGLVALDAVEVEADPVG